VEGRRICRSPQTSGAVYRLCYLRRMRLENLMLNRLSASQRRAVSALMLLLSIAFVETSHAQTTVNVSTASQLQNAVAEANNAGGNRTIMVAPGTYTLSDTLYVNASNITIAGPAGQRANVIIQGDAMSADAKVGNVIRV